MTLYPQVPHFALSSLTLNKKSMDPFININHHHHHHLNTTSCSSATSSSSDTSSSDSTHNNRLDRIKGPWSSEEDKILTRLVDR